MHRVRLASWCSAAFLFAVLGCHRHTEDAPLAERKIGFADKFYDVQAIDATRAVVVGYSGKILMTEDGGQTWQQSKSGTRRALYSVKFVNGTHGWACGQDGVLIHTSDGGKTWSKQKSGTPLPMFAVDFVNEREGWVVGDQATYLHTEDGGQTWSLAKFKMSEDFSGEEALVAADPVLYDVQFVNRETGWVAGEFGHIYHTPDGGKTWVEQQESLLQTAAAGSGAGTRAVTRAIDIPTFFGVHFDDPMNGLVAGIDGTVARTRDGGQHWKFEEFELDLPLIDPLFEPFQLPNTPAWALGAAGEVVRQNEPGAAWKRASLGMDILTWLRGIDFSDPKNGWIVGGRGMILRTTDGGKTWLPSLG